MKIEYYYKQILKVLTMCVKAKCQCLECQKKKKKTQVNFVNVKVEKKNMAFFFITTGLQSQSKGN